MSDRFLTQFEAANEQNKSVDEQSMMVAQNTVVKLLRDLEKSERISSLKDSKLNPAKPDGASTGAG